MKYTTISFRQPNGSKAYYMGVKFYNGQVWTKDRYTRLLKMQIMRRRAIAKQIESALTRQLRMSFDYDPDLILGRATKDL